MSRISARSRRAATALVLGLAAAVAFSTPAAAHSTIIDSTPAADAVLAAAPKAFSVTANEPLADITGAGDGFALEVVDAATGETMTDGPLAIDGATLSTPGVELAPGAYVMRYQVVSADGHPISGEIAFAIAGESAPTAPGPDRDAGSAEAPTWPIWLAITLAAALLAVGIVLVVRRRR